MCFGPASRPGTRWKRPEQRASLEARLMELAGQIEHKSLKYHYIAAFRERLRAAGKARRLKFWNGSLAAPRADRRPAAAGPLREAAFPAVNARTGSLLASKIAQASTPLTAPREALLIGAIIRHPWLLDDFLEEIAGLQLQRCRLPHACVTDILTVHQAEELLDNEKLLEHLSRDGYGAELERVERATAHNADAHFSRTGEQGASVGRVASCHDASWQSGRSTLVAGSRERIPQRTDGRKFLQAQSDRAAGGNCGILISSYILRRPKRSPNIDAGAW